MPWQPHVTVRTSIDHCARTSKQTLLQLSHPHDDFHSSFEKYSAIRDGSGTEQGISWMILVFVDENVGMSAISASHAFSSAAEVILHAHPANAVSASAACLLDRSRDSKVTVVYRCRRESKSSLFRHNIHHLPTGDSVLRHPAGSARASSLGPTLP